MRDKNNFVPVGKISTAHGIRGQVKIRYYTATPESLLSYKNITDESGNIYNLQSAKIAGGNIIASIEGVKDRNAAENLVGTELFIPKSDLPDTESGEYYQNDFIGMEVRLADGRKFGEVAGFHNYGAGDLIEIFLSDNTSKSELFVFNERNFPEINIEECYMIISPPEVI